jgi:hypothetical protein
VRSGQFAHGGQDSVFWRNMQDGWAVLPTVARLCTGNQIERQ